MARTAAIGIRIIAPIIDQSDSPTVFTTTGKGSFESVHKQSSNLVDSNATSNIANLANKVIGVKDILQADATIIAGILILLTISTLIKGRTIVATTKARSVYLICILGSFVMFFISAANAVGNFLEPAILAFAAGLCFLTVAIGVLIVNLLRSSEEGNTGINVSS